MNIHIRLELIPVAQTQGVAQVGPGLSLKKILSATKYLLP